MSASCLPTRGGTELLCHGKASTIKEHNLSSAASSLPLFCASDATHCLPPTIYPYPATTDHVAPLRPLPLRTFATVTTTLTTATVYTTATTDNVAPLLPLPLRCTLPPTPLRHPPELSRLDSTTLYLALFSGCLVALGLFFSDLSFMSYGFSHVMSHIVLVILTRLYCVNLVILTVGWL